MAPTTRDWLDVVNDPNMHSIAESLLMTAENFELFVTQAADIVGRLVNPLPKIVITCSSSEEKALGTTADIVGGSSTKKDLEFEAAVMPFIETCTV